MSGKSEYLIHAYNSSQCEGISTGIFQPVKNTRNSRVESRSGLAVPAGKISTLQEIEIGSFETVIIDELHLFDNPSEQLDWCSSARSLGTKVLAGMVDYDYRGVEMPAYNLSLQIEPDSIFGLVARCSEIEDCSNPARYTALLINGAQQIEGEQIIVDDEMVMYSPRCGDHFLPIQTRQIA